MSAFTVTVRTESGQRHQFTAIGRTAIDVHIQVLEEFGKTSYPHAGNELVFFFFTVEAVGGEFTVNVHEQIKWVSITELIDYVFCF